MIWFLDCLFCPCSRLNFFNPLLSNIKQYVYSRENVQVFNGHKLCKGIGVVFNCLIGRSFKRTSRLSTENPKKLKNLNHLPDSSKHFKSRFASLTSNGSYGPFLEQSTFTLILGLFADNDDYFQSICLESTPPGKVEYLDCFCSSCWSLLKHPKIFTGTRNFGVYFTKQIKRKKMLGGFPFPPYTCWISIQQTSTKALLRSLNPFIAERGRWIQIQPQEQQIRRELWMCRYPFMYQKGYM